jgi:hypothetical protein
MCSLKTQKEGVYLGWDEICENPTLHICGCAGLILVVYFASRSVQPCLYNAKSPFCTVSYLVQKTRENDT